MSWRFRKSIRIAKGVHINLGKKGASVTVGGHGLTQTYGHVKGAYHCRAARNRGQLYTGDWQEKATKQ